MAEVMELEGNKINQFIRSDFKANIMQSQTTHIVSIGRLKSGKHVRTNSYGTLERKETHNSLNLLMWSD